MTYSIVSYVDHLFSLVDYKPAAQDRSKLMDHIYNYLKRNDLYKLGYSQITDDKAHTVHVFDDEDWVNFGQDILDALPPNLIHLQSILTKAQTYYKDQYAKSLRPTTQVTRPGLSDLAKVDLETTLISALEELSQKEDQVTLYQYGQHFTYLIYLKAFENLSSRKEELADMLTQISNTKKLIANDLANRVRTTHLLKPSTVSKDEQNPKSATYFYKTSELCDFLLNQTGIISDFKNKRLYEKLRTDIEELLQHRNYIESHLPLVRVSAYANNLMKDWTGPEDKRQNASIKIRTDIYRYFKKKNIQSFDLPFQKLETNDRVVFYRKEYLDEWAQNNKKKIKGHKERFEKLSNKDPEVEARAKQDSKIHQEKPVYKTSFKEDKLITNIPHDILYSYLSRVVNVETLLKDLEAVKDIDLSNLEQMEMSLNTLKDLTGLSSAQEEMLETLKRLSNPFAAYKV